MRGRLEPRLLASFHLHWSARVCIQTRRPAPLCARSAGISLSGESAWVLSADTRHRATEVTLQAKGMAKMTRVILTVLTWGLCAAAHAQFSPASGEELTPSSVKWGPDRGVSIQLDNDLFSGAHRDQDYSWGMAAAFASPTSSRLFRPLDRARNQIYSRVTPGDANRPGWQPDERGVQIGVIAMTPSTLRSANPLFGDRPFASLVFVTSGEVHPLENNPDRARFSSFTVGMLGLNVAEQMHRGIHGAVGDEKPLGWKHQIADGGELTARYVQAEQWLLGGSAAQRPGRPEMKFTLSGSAGYLTEASAAFSARWGRIQSPWWSFSPEIGDYTQAPLAPRTGFDGPGLQEVYLFAGMRVKARAYNALLQGQFRDSTVRVSGDDLARLPAEAWVGLTSSWSDLRITYSLRYASREITREPGARSMIWAGIAFERTF
jgi:hypothetical protein